MLRLLADEAGVKDVKVAPISAGLMRVLGVFSTLLRELSEIRYQFDNPFVVDSSAYTERFGVSATPIEEQITATLHWWRRKPAA